jgi:urease accessory protein
MPMMMITERWNGTGEAEDKLILPFELRQKSRLKVRLDSGEEAALLLDRGIILRGGDRLRADNGRIIAVHAATEAVLEVRSSDPQKLMRAAYHLGNRHVPLQIGEGWLRILEDHVLEHMLAELGLEAHPAEAPFEPEAGAYAASHEHSHHHGH